MAHYRGMDENEGSREGRVIRRIPSDTFGHRLMLARADSGNLTIQEAAEKCGLLSQSWSNWERGRIPRDILDVAEAVAEGLSVDRDWLLFGGPLAKAPKSRTGRTRWPYSPMAHSSQSTPPSRRVRRPRRIDGKRRTAA